MKKIPLIIDADPGIDDAVALMMATKSNMFDIKMVSCTAGNTNLENVTTNTIGVLELLGEMKMPVAKGCAKPIKRESFSKEIFHGIGGMGGYVFENLKHQVDKIDAVTLMHEVLNASEEKVTIVALGPLSNIATLFLKHPEDKEKIERLVFMGGSYVEKGDKTPYAEFNISSDPEAAEVVFASKVKMVMVPMEMGHTAYLDWHDVFVTKEENMTGEFLEFIYRSYHDGHVKNGIATHDGTTVAYLIEPEIFETKPAKVSVVYFKEINSGVAICDFEAEPNMEVCVKVDVKKFKKLYFNALRKCD